MTLLLPVIYPPFTPLYSRFAVSGVFCCRYFAFQNKTNIFFIHLNFIKMKIGTYVANAQGNIDPQKVFRPLQTILVDIHGENGQSIEFKTLTAKLNVTLINSTTGSQDSIIPFVSLTQLAEVATMHEGSVLHSSFGASNTLLIPVLLNPTSNLQINNDKYLDIEISGLVPGAIVDIYGFESQSMSDMVCRYSKFSMPIGTSRQSTQTGNNDFLCLPIVGFDSIRITYASGVVADLSPRELQYMMAKENDITLSSVDGSFMIYSYANSYVIDLAGVKSFEIVRDSNSTTPFEFLLGDLH